MGPFIAYTIGRVLGATVLYVIARLIAARSTSKKVAAFIAAGIVIAIGCVGTNVAEFLTSFITAIALLVFDIARQPPKSVAPPSPPKQPCRNGHREFVVSCPACVEMVKKGLWG